MAVLEFSSPSYGETFLLRADAWDRNMEFDKGHHVVGGTGEFSYASNSKLQENALFKTKPIVQKAMTELYGNILPERLAIADLGCSSGSNTFMVIVEIINAVVSSCHRINCLAPEIQFFLNDLPSNDFNTLFRSLPSYKKKIREEIPDENVTFYVVGVPGSFYEPLFPKESIHFFHSSYSLQWLSQVPEGLESEVSPPLNKQNIYISKTSPQIVSELYSEQFRRGFSTFLKQRSQEIVKGGHMVLSFLGRTCLDAADSEYSYLFWLLADALNSMVFEGFLEEEMVSKFNLPGYAASVQEVEEIIQSEGSFHLDRIQTFETNWDPFDDSSEEIVLDELASGKNVAKSIRATVGPMLAAHFGEEIIEELFSRYAGNVARHLLKQKTKHVTLVVTLKRRE